MAVYNAYFHPLAHVPGPKINAITRLPYIRHLLAGTTVDNVQALHRKYGDVVRVTPNEISFTSSEAWQDIYGFRTGKLKNHSSMQKDPIWFPPPLNGAPSILVANDVDHAAGRRTLSHAFSEKALAEQEVLIQQYVDLLVDKMKEKTSESKAPLDMVQWYNWCTFDIIADLCFGEPFGCLQSTETHKYIHLLLQSVAGFRLYYIMSYFPWVKYLGSLVIDKTLMAGRIEYNKWVFSQAEKRCEMETQRPDFMTHILKHNDESKGAKLSQDTINSNASLFITAGSETTATLMSSVTYLLLKNPEVLRKLVEEVRGRWSNYNDITLEEVNKAPYLLAVLNEGLRYFPPVPTGFQRQVPKGGETVSGYYIPEDSKVFVSQYPTSHSESNFVDADSFVPERWLGDERYAKDNKAAFQPFSFGPRNCLGKVS